MASPDGTERRMSVVGPKARNPVERETSPLGKMSLNDSFQLRIFLNSHGESSPSQLGGLHHRYERRAT